MVVPRPLASDQFSGVGRQPLIGSHSVGHLMAATLRSVLATCQPSIGLRTIDGFRLLSVPYSATGSLHRTSVREPSHETFTDEPLLAATSPRNLHLSTVRAGRDPCPNRYRIGGGPKYRQSSLPTSRTQVTRRPSGADHSFLCEDSLFYILGRSFSSRAPFISPGSIRRLKPKEK